MDVRRVLGDNVVDTLLREVDEGRIKEQHAEVIAQELHPRTRGNFERDRQARGYQLDRRAFQKILSDWYSMSSRAEHELGVQKLIDVMEGPDVHLKYLASLLQEAHKSDENDRDKNLEFQLRGCRSKILTLESELSASRIKNQTLESKLSESRKKESEWKNKAETFERRAQNLEREERRQRRQGHEKQRKEDSSLISWVAYAFV